MTALQLSPDGRLRHLLTPEGLPRALLERLLDRAKPYAEADGRKESLLHGRTVVNLFFENSTRTRTTFEMAAHRLSADVVNLQIAASSTAKGETLFDTLRTLEAMRADLFVVRHEASGAAHFFAQHAAPGVAILNAGDGRHAHPTQALLDAYTLREHFGRIEGLSIAIVGDVAHSRVARSNLHCLRALGCTDLRVVGPPTLIPAGIETLGATVEHDLMRGLHGVDAVILLRLQKERMVGALLPSLGEFHRQYGLTEARLAKLKPEARFLHPGPINRGVEIEGELAYAPRSMVLDQVRNGVPVRMAVMAEILGTSEPTDRRRAHGDAT